VADLEPFSAESLKGAGDAIRGSGFELVAYSAGGRARDQVGPRNRIMRLGEQALRRWQEVRRDIQDPRLDLITLLITVSLRGLRSGHACVISCLTEPRRLGEYALENR
jgi:hypothetical protein